MTEKKKMADNAVDIEDREKKMSISNHWILFFDHPPKVTRRKRTRVDYCDCNCDKKPKIKAPETAVMPNGDDPGAKMANGHDLGAEVPAAMMNGDDSSAEKANGNDPGAAIINGGDPGGEIVNGDDSGAAMVNVGDPGAELPAMENGEDSGAAMVNVGDPGAEIGNNDDRGAEFLAMENVGDPGAELPAMENGEDSEIPAAMREHIIGMGGYGMRLIIEKVLTATDMRTDQGRLSLPPKKLRAEFLTAAEERFLVRRGDEGETGLNYIDAIILGPDLRESGIRFKKWRIGAKYANCLMNKWNSFARAHHLRAGNTVRLWTFRVDRLHPQTNTINSELCFALDKF